MLSSYNLHESQEVAQGNGSTDLATAALPADVSFQGVQDADVAVLGRQVDRRHPVLLQHTHNHQPSTDMSRPS